MDAQKAAALTELNYIVPFVILSNRFIVFMIYFLLDPSI
jgi:hypothetical protein